MFVDICTQLVVGLLACPASVFFLNKVCDRILVMYDGGKISRPYWPVRVEIRLMSTQDNPPRLPFARM